MTLILLLVVALVAFRAMKPQERTRLLQTAAATAARIKAQAKRPRPEYEAFWSALRARTPRVLVTPALVALNVTVFVLMLAGAGNTDLHTLLIWGGNFGPRTTNGEWWRLLSSMFVHTGLLHLLVNTVCLLQIGAVLERMIGRFAFATGYFGAGVFASLTTLSARPVAVSVGASGAISGLYGLLLASSLWIRFQRLPGDGTSIAIPTVGVTRLVSGAVLFTIFNPPNNGVPFVAELSGLAAGFICGLLLASGVIDREPPARRVALVIAVAGTIAVAAAVPLAGLIDVRPEIGRIIVIEDRTARAYQAARDQFNKGATTARALADVIERKIVPELQAADLRLKSLHRIAPEQQPLVADAEEYLRLRSESWRLRVAGLRQTNPAAFRQRTRVVETSETSERLRAEAQHRATALTMGKAEGTERASLEVLERLKNLPAAMQ